MRASISTIFDHLAKHKFPYILLALTLGVNVLVLRDLVQDWIRDDNYSHGFLVIPVAIYVFAVRRAKLNFPAVPDRLGLVLFVLGSVGLLVGIAASEFFTTRMSLILQVTGIGLYYLGRKNFSHVWFAFLYLGFMVPIPSILYYQATLPMQLLASKVTTVLLEVVGVPVLRQGNIIHLPDYSLEVAEACSGLRSLVALLAVGSLYAWHIFEGWVRPVALTLAMIPIAIAANVFRIFATGLGAYAISKDVADTFLHEISGLMVFGLAVIALVILGAILKWTEKRSQ